MLVAYLISISALLLWVAKLRRSLAKACALLKMQEEQHRINFAELISKINHEGQVPIASTALGLIVLISLAMNKCLSWLEALRNNKDWRTHSVSEELSGIKNVELSMAENRLRTLIKTIREVLEQNNHRQEKNTPCKPK